MSTQELFTYWQVIKKRLWLIGLLVGVTMGVILLVSYLSPPLYRATTSFQVTTPLPTEVSLVSDFRTATSREELGYTRNNFLAVLKSEYVAGLVIEQLHLNMDVQQVAERMVLEPVEGSDFMKLSVTASHPDLAAAMANTTTDKASQYFAELSAASLTANKKTIQQQLQERKKELDEARAALVQFQVENGLGSQDGTLHSQENLITAAKSNRDQALAEGKQETATNYDQIIATRERELQARILLDSKFQDLQGTVARLESTYTDLLNKETEAELKENDLLSAQFIQVVPARVPSRPLPRLDPKVMVVGAVVSLALGILLAFALEYSTRSAAATNEEDKGSAGVATLKPGQAKPSQV
jgi:uncharacterized protein involved in exopolysaccharide biosynthesis